MRVYIIRQLLLVVPTVFLVTLIVFVTVRLIPGDIVDLIASKARSGTVNREAIESLLGLDVPWPIQYGRWTGDMIFHGSLGTSLSGKEQVLDIILHRLPVSFELSLMALVISLIIALPIGIYSAIRQDSWGDYVVRSMAIVFISVPSFWIATVVMIFPALWWGWAPGIEYIPFSEDPWGNLGQFIIPATILGMVLCGTTMRMTRTMMLEVLRKDYLRTAWSKGLKERVVVTRHVLKNALIPVITIVGLYLILLVEGAVILEQIFNLPRVGRLMMSALFERDYSVVSGLNLIVAIGAVGINVLVDLTYAKLDPRVQYK